MEQYLSRGPLGTAASSTCKQEIQGGEWCNVNKDNCEIGCSGKWCTNLMPLTYKPTTTKPTTRKPSNRMPTSKPQAFNTKADNIQAHCTANIIPHNKGTFHASQPDHLQ